MLILQKGWWLNKEGFNLDWAPDWLKKITVLPDIKNDDESKHFGIVFWTNPDGSVIPCGVTTLVDGEFTFVYHPDYVESPDTKDIAYRLPKKKEPYKTDNPGYMHSFFDNLVSEGWLALAQSVALGDIPPSYLGSERQAIDTSIVEKSDNTRIRYRRLLYFGKSCHGAVSLFPARGNATLIEIEDEAMSRAVASGGIIGGAQRKFLAVLDMTKKREDGTIPYHESAPFEPSTHIVKLDNPSKFGIVENEVITGLLTAHLLANDNVATGMPGSFPLDQSGVKAVAIERFDRTQNGGRIHFEEAAQLLGIPADKQYEGSYKELAKLTADLMGKDGVITLFKRVIVQFLTGNADGHLKNIAFWKDNEGKWSLVPNYDLVCTDIYQRRGDAMDRISLHFHTQESERGMNHRRLHDISPKIIFTLGHIFGLQNEEIRDSVMEIAQLFPLRLVHFPESIGGVEYNRNLMLDLLTKVNGRAEHMLGKGQSVHFGHRHPDGHGHEIVEESHKTVYGVGIQRCFYLLKERQQSEHRGP